MTVTRGPGEPIFSERRGRAHARRTRRRRIAAWAVGVVGAAIVFSLGVALGRALDEAPQPGGTQTLVRTLEPQTLPRATRTVTVTTVGE